MRSVTTTVIATNEQTHPLTNLKSEDFKVIEKDQELRITGFRRTGTSKSFITSRPPDGYVVSNRPLAAFYFPQPVTLLLLDTADTDPVFQPWMEAQCMRFFTMMRPTENVAVYQLAKGGVRLLHEFSNAPAAMADEISPGGLVRGTDRFVLSPQIAPMDESTATELEREGNNADLSAARYGHSCAEVTKMARYLGDFSGRKNLMWMSADFPPFGEKGTQNEDLTGGVCRDMLFTLAAADVAVYPVDVRSEIAVEPFVKPLPGSMEALPAKRRAALSRALAASMVTLSAITGGKPIANRSQLAEVMTDSVEASRSFYQLSFEPRAWDGKIHVMRVASTLRQADVLAKRLYLAGTPGGMVDSGFDSPAVGISVTAAANSAGTRFSVFVAARDLTWEHKGKDWRTAAQFTIGNELPVVKGFELSDDAYSTLDKQTVSIEAETRATVSVRDMASGRAGSLTIPVGGKKQ